jgi:hypothetical protein
MSETTAETTEISIIQFKFDELKDQLRSIKQAILVQNDIIDDLSRRNTFYSVCTVIQLTCIAFLISRM